MLILIIAERISGRVYKKRISSLWGQVRVGKEIGNRADESRNGSKIDFIL